MRKLAVIGAGIAAIGALLGARNCTTASIMSNSDPASSRLVGSNSDGWYGFWRFERGGPYVLGTQCDDACTLRVDGKTIASGKGVAVRRVVFAPGVYAVEVQRSGGGRLVWHPPGRRGPLEYTPPSVVGPTRASVESASASTVSDGLFALSILAVILTMVVLLLRGVFPRARGSEGAKWIEVAAVFAVALAVRWIGLGDAGQTWDEDVNWSAGRNYITNLLALDFRIGSWQWNLEHPPLMKYIAGIGAQFADGYGPARVASAIMMSLACALIVPVASRLGLTSAGLAAGLFAGLSPHLVGHGQIVGHESAMALTWMLAICAAVCVWPCGGGSRLETRLAVCGAAVGLAIASRFVNGLVAPLVYAVVIISAPADRRGETAWKAAVIMPLAAVAVFLALWPRMWSAPVDHLSEAWAVLKKPHMAEWFLGTRTNSPTRTYFAIYLVVTAPIGLLLAASGGLAWLVAKRQRAAAIALLWIAMPMVVMFSPVRQDGVRYIIPSLLALALMAGIGVEVGGRWLARKWPRPFVSRAVAGVVAIYLALVCVSIRPYFIDYYGEHVGGTVRVAERKSFEVAWWGEGVRAAIDYLNSNAEPGARVYRCVAPSHLTWMRHDLWKPAARRPADADWAVIYNPLGSGCQVPPGFSLVFEVDAGGAPLAQVYRRNRASP